MKINEDFLPLVISPTEPQGKNRKKVWMQHRRVVKGTEVYVDDKEYILNENNIYEKFEPQNEIYSTKEQKIGTWIDGKPLYRKVINVTIPSTNTDGQLSDKVIDISNNINKVIKTYGYIEDTHSTFPSITFLPVWITDSGNKIKTYIIGADKRLYISNEIKDFSNLEATIIVEYTKNTD